MSSQDAAINIALRLVDQATAPMNRAMAMVEKSTSAAERQMQMLTATVRMAVGAFTALGLSIGVSELIKTADTWKNLQGRLKLVTESAEQLADVEQRLFAVAQNTRVGYEETATLYARIARSTQEMNLGQEKTLLITDTINKTLIVSGSSAQAADAALIQLGQGFAAGALRGQELNSVLEQAPRLAQAIADGMGVSVGQLKKFGEEGKLSAEAVAQALVSQASAVNTEFEKMPKTVGQAGVVINNTLGKMISGLDTAGGFTGVLSEKMIELAGVVERNGKPIVYTFSAIGDAIYFPFKLVSEFSEAIIATGFEVVKFFEMVENATSGNMRAAKQNWAELQDIIDDFSKSTGDRWSKSNIESARQMFNRLDTKQPYLPGPEGLDLKKSPPPDENAIKLAKKLADQWADTRRDLEQQINLSGLDGLDKELLQITQRADDLREKFGDKGLIDAWMEAAQNSAIQADYLDRQKKAQDELKKTTESYHDALIASLPEYEQAVAKVAQQYRELDIAILDAHNSGIISAEKAIEIQDQLSERQIEAIDAIKEKTDDLSQFQIQAYRNMQDAGARFFESLRTGSDDWLDSFEEMTLKMVDQWASAQMMMGLFGSDFAKGGDLGGLLGVAASSLAGMFGSYDGITSAAAPGMSYTGSYDSFVPPSADFKFADGGWIKEPVVGVGLRSGGRYSFAENESELVMNQSQVRAASTQPSGSAPSTGPAPINITIIAADAQSITDMMRRNPQAVLGPLNDALQRGDRGLRSNLQRVIS